MPTPHHSVFYRPDALPAAHPSRSSYRKSKKTFKNCKLGFFSPWAHTALASKRAVSHWQPTYVFDSKLSSLHWQAYEWLYSVLQHLCWLLQLRVHSVMVFVDVSEILWMLPKTVIYNTILVKLLIFVDFCVFLGVLAVYWLTFVIHPWSRFS